MALTVCRLRRLVCFLDNALRHDAIVVGHLCSHTTSYVVGPRYPREWMVATAKAREPHEYLALLDALLYGDVFGCAVTLDELWQYARVAIERDKLRLSLRDDPVLRRLVVERDGLHCLVGRTPLLSERPERILRAERLQRRAHRVARVLRHAPFVNGLVLTGSTSADDAPRRADVDLLVIAERIGSEPPFSCSGPSRDFSDAGSSVRTGI